MSDNYLYRRRPADSDLRPEPHRRAPADSDLRPEPGSYGVPERLYSSQDHDFYRPSQASSSFQRTSLPSASRAQWPQEGALNILNSCGLEPSDLTLLAELPEDVLTLESLPYVLKQIKGKRGTVKPFPPSAPPPSSSSSSSPHSSAHRPVVTGDWDPLPNQPLQYPVNWITASPAAADVVRRESPRSSSSGRVDPPSSSSLSSSYLSDLHLRSSDNDRTGRVASPASAYDYHPLRSDFGKTGAGPASSRDHHPLPSDLGKMGRGAGPASSRGYLQRLSDYGKTGGVSAPVSSQNHISSLARGSKSIHPSPFPEPAALRPGLPAEAHPLKTLGGLRETPSPRSSGPVDSSSPSMREATDFHGATPPSYPYSCCLCDITVMTERVWIKHINGPHHADGQLSLLQRFPKWDCRMETVCRAENQSESKVEGKPQLQTQPQMAHHSSDQKQKTKSQKASDRSKVVCVKFPAQAVDEAYLRKLVQPFGRIVQMLMFPSLAFVELGSVDQAKDLVKFHVNNPPTVNGEQMEFSISTTFSFLQSSRVVSFSPGPSGKNGKSDLMSVVKRFGAPLFTMFLPSMAFVEMKNAADAQMLVDYYSSQSLRINNHVIKVSFSKEYKSLLRIGMAKKYVEDSDPKQTTRSLSQEKENKTTEEDDSSRERKTRTRERSSRDQRSRTRSRERSKRDKRSRTRSRERSRSKRDKRTRSRERSRSKRDKRSRSRERSRSKRDKRSRTRSRERSSSKRYHRTRSTSSDESSSIRRTRTRSKSREKSSKETRTRSRSTEKPTTEERSKDKSSRDWSPRARSTSRERRSGSKSRSTGVSVEPEKATESKTDPDPAPSRDSRPVGEDREQPKTEELSSAEDSDIEGMEVIGEDGESLLDEDMETLDEAEKEEEEEEEEAAEITDLPEEEKEDEVMEGEEDDEECETKKQEESKEMDEEMRGFPEYLENCITLDELEEDQWTDKDEDEDEDDDEEPPSCRVVYFGNVPLHRCSDAQFIQLVRNYGRPVGYHLKPPTVGFIEMSSSSEARRVVQQLNSRNKLFYGFKLRVGLSEKYSRLGRRWEISPDEDKDERREGRSQNSRRSKSPNRNESDKKLEGSKRSKISPEKSLEKDPSGKTPEKDSSSKNTPEKDSASRKTLEKDLSSKKTLEKDSSPKKTPEKDSPSRKTSEKDSSLEKTLEKDSSSKKTLEQDSSSRKTLEKDSASKKTLEKDPSSKKTPEKDPSSKKTPEKDSASKKTLEKDSSSQNTLEKDSSSKKTPEKAPSGKTLEKDSSSKKTLEKDSSSKKTPEKAPSGKTLEKDSSSKKTLEKDSASIKTLEKDSASKKTLEKDPSSERTPEKDPSGKTLEKDSASKKTPEKDPSGKTLEKDSASKKTPEKDSPPERTPEKDLSLEKTPEKDPSGKTLEKDSASRKTLEKDPSGKTLEKDSASRKTLEKDSASKKTLEKDSSSKKTPEKDSPPERTPDEESASETVRKGPEDFESRTVKRSPDGSPENESVVKSMSEQISRTPNESSSSETSLENQTLKRRQTRGNDSVPQKKRRESTREAQGELMEVQRDRSGPGMEEPKSPYQPDSTGDPRPGSEQKPTSEIKVEHQSEPAGGDAELQPDKPVGTEFVRPVVGYFCNLCQVIYADEDEAKLQHCSSAAHYRKYQEKTGKDPWAM